MPPAVGAAAVTAGGTLLGSALSSRASNKAAGLQSRATSEALQFSRENEMRRRQEYDQAQALQRQQWEAEQARLAPRRAARDALLARMGYRGGSAPMTLKTLAAPAATPPQAASAPMGATQPKRLTLADFGWR